MKKYTDVQRTSNLRFNNGFVPSFRTFIFRRLFKVMHIYNICKKAAWRCFFEMFNQWHRHFQGYRKDCPH